MIVEPPGVDAGVVGSSVAREWELDVTDAEHLPVGSGAWHWRVAAEPGPWWFASVHAVRTAEERGLRLDAFESTTVLGRSLPFVVAPVHTRDARIAVDVAPGLLLSLTPLLDGSSGPGPFADDSERAQVAGLLGALHRSNRPRQLPAWQPRVGWHPRRRQPDLEEAMAQTEWTGGRWSAPARRVVAESRPLIESTLSRFALLGAAVSHSADRWVVTHGQPHTANLLSTSDGPRLVDWDTVALAPRERDLRQVLGDAEGGDPWFAYVEGGGLPESLAPDSVELFALEWHLSEIAENGVRLFRPHEDTPDSHRALEDLEAEVAALTEGWA